MIVVLIIGAVLFALFFCGAEDVSHDANISYDEGQESEEESSRLFDKVYADGSWRTKGVLSDYDYSDGKHGWIGFWGEEHRSNGEVVHSNGYVYNSSGEHIGYEFEDVFGITHRHELN